MNSEEALGPDEKTVAKRTTSSGIAKQLVGLVGEICCMGIYLVAVLKPAILPQIVAKFAESFVGVLVAIVCLLLATGVSIGGLVTRISRPEPNRVRASHSGESRTRPVLLIGIVAVSFAVGSIAAIAVLTFWGVVPLPRLGDSISSSFAFLRSGPSDEYPIAGRYAAGTSLKIVGKDFTDCWVKAEMPDGLIGWLPTECLVLNTDLDRVATVSAPLPPTPCIGCARVGHDGMMLMYVPAGEFIMGSAALDPVAFPNEKPQHEIALDAFWIDRNEVTNAMFSIFVAATGFRTGAEKGGVAKVHNFRTLKPESIEGADWRHPFGPSSSIIGLDQHPVVQVNWADAEEYCRWAGRRLPTEAEWEKAARGIDGPRYPWGDADPTEMLANFADRRVAELPWASATVDDGYRFTAPVGTYPAAASPYGALDMAGNVWEWVNDRYEHGYYTHSPTQNPQGPPSGVNRSTRGGAWSGEPKALRTSHRDNMGDPNASTDVQGFRCARSDVE